MSSTEAGEPTAPPLDGAADDGGAAAHPAPFPLPGGAPAPQPAQRHRVLTRGSLVCGVLSLFIIGAGVTPEGLMLGAVVAVIPVPVYVVLALWLDRFEPEPARTLAQTFAWGATVAVFLALVLNSAIGVFAEGYLGPEGAEVFFSVVSAPVVEEVAKGLALLFLFRELKDEFDGVVDGVVYAAMVGLGFAMLENVQYYGVAFDDGVETGVGTFIVRGMVAPFAHPLFTSMFGIGLGYARERHGHGSRVWAPALGLAAAMLLHSMWNLAAGMDDTLFFVLYVGVMVPTFFGVLLLIVVSLRREGRVIREHLLHLVDEGWLKPGELERLCRVRHRLRASARALMSGGLTRWRARREMHRMASELAFHRWRVRRGLTLGAEADAQREAEYLARLRELCEGLPD